MEGNSGVSARGMPAGRAALLAVLVVTLVGWLYTPPVYRLLGGRTVLWIYDLANIAVACLGAWLAFLLWRSFKPGETLSIIWGFLATGLTLWALGEIIWSSDQLLFGEKLPYPSTADVVWLAGYVPVILALALRFRTFQMRLARPVQFAALSAFGLGAAFTILTVIVPILQDSQAGGTLEKLVNVLYPIGDLTVAFFALLIVLVLMGGKLVGAWGLIAFGYLSLAISDVLYAYGVWQGTYQVDPALGLDFMSYLINLLYTASYVLVALGLYQRARLQNAV